MKTTVLMQLQFIAFCFTTLNDFARFWLYLCNAAAFILLSFNAEFCVIACLNSKYKLSTHSIVPNTITSWSHIAIPIKKLINKSIIKVIHAEGCVKIKQGFLETFSVYINDRLNSMKLPDTQKICSCVFILSLVIVILWNAIDNRLY